MIPKWAPTQKNRECGFGKVGVPVPELDDQFWNWNGAEMRSNIYMQQHHQIMFVVHTCQTATKAEDLVLEMINKSEAATTKDLKEVCYAARKRGRK